MNYLKDPRLKKLSAVSKNPKVLEFTKYYNFWKAFFDSIINNPINEQNPNMHSLVNNLKLIVLTGFAENLGEGEGYREKFSQFLNYLNLEEKFFFCLIFETKLTNKEINGKFQTYLENGSQELLNELMKVHQEDDEKKQKSIHALLKAFYNDEAEKIQQDFNDKVSSLYSIRSDIVHTGEPVIGTAIGTGTHYFYGETKNKLFYIKYKNIEEFFLRAALRQSNLDPEPINSVLGDYIINNYLSRHASLATRITYQKLKLTTNAG